MPVTAPPPNFRKRRLSTSACRLPVDYMNDAVWARIDRALEDYDLMEHRPEDGRYDIYLRGSS